MPKYALAVISDGGEVMTFSSEIPSRLKTDEDIYEEVKLIHNLDDDEIADIIVIESKSKVSFDQLDLSNL